MCGLAGSINNYQITQTVEPPAGVRRVSGSNFGKPECLTNPSPFIIYILFNLLFNEFKSKRLMKYS